MEATTVPPSREFKGTPSAPTAVPVLKKETPKISPEEINEMNKGEAENVQGVQALIENETEEPMTKEQAISARLVDRAMKFIHKIEEPRARLEMAKTLLPFIAMLSANAVNADPHTSEAIKQILAAATSSAIGGLMGHGFAPTRRLFGMHKVDRESLNFRQKIKLYGLEILDVLGGVVGMNAVSQGVEHVAGENAKDALSVADDVVPHVLKAGVNVISSSPK